jgi:hypothetical protein
MSKAERAVGMVNRLAQLFGEVVTESGDVESVKMNPVDLNLLRGYECMDSDGLMWGAWFTEDPTLLPGTASISKLGKRMIY